MAHATHDSHSHDHTDGEYVHGQMPIEEQKGTWDAFIKASWFGSLLLGVVLAYLVFVFGVGTDWLVTLIGVAGASLILGALMNYGRAWVGSIVGMSILAVIVKTIAILWSAAF
jgi:hypothetical protein